MGVFWNDPPAEPKRGHRTYLPNDGWLGDRRDALESAAYVLISDLEAENLSPPEWGIQNLYTHNGLVVVIAPRGVGKTFLALGWAFSHASGLAWLGHAARHGRVVYIMAEGRGGLPGRVRAQKEYLGLEGEVGVYFLTTVVPLLGGGEVDRLIRCIHVAGVSPGVIVVDTLSRTFAGGDENSSKDMAKYVSALDRLKAEVGGTVIVLHHTGHENRHRERGSSVLGGAADTMVSLHPKPGDAIELACMKQKDAPEFPPIRLRLVPAAGSRVLVQDSPEAFPASRLTENQKKSLRALQDGFLSDGATATDWEAASGLQHSSFHNARATLVDRGLVTRVGKIRGARYRITEAGLEALKVQRSTEGP